MANTFMIPTDEELAKGFCLPDLSKSELVNLKADIMVGMLNGTYNWDNGCHLRNIIDNFIEEDKK